RPADDREGARGGGALRSGPAPGVTRLYSRSVPGDRTSNPSIQRGILPGTRGGARRRARVGAPKPPESRVFRARLPDAEASRVSSGFTGPPPERRVDR